MPDEARPLSPEGGTTGQEPADDGTQRRRDPTDGATQQWTPADDGATQQWTPADRGGDGLRAAEPEPGGTTTAPAPAGTATEPLGASPWAQPEGARWSGRAGIPPAHVPYATNQSWYEEPPPRRWVAPVLIGLLLVLLLGLLGFAVWQASRGQSPSVTPTTPVTTSAPSPSASTSASPSPTPSETTPGPVTVVVPPIGGLSVADARQLLDAAGLRYAITEQVNPSLPPGTVLSSNPSPGAGVPPGTTVAVVIAAPAPTPFESPTPTGTSPEPQPGG